jgi:hypothetical protein
MRGVQKGIADALCKRLCLQRQRGRRGQHRQRLPAAQPVAHRPERGCPHLPDRIVWHRKMVSHFTIKHILTTCRLGAL